MQTISSESSHMLKKKNQLIDNQLNVSQPHHKQTLGRMICELL